MITGGSESSRTESPEATRSRARELELEEAAMGVLAANQRMRHQLDAYDLVITESLEKYRSGMALLDVVRQMPPADATIGSEVEVIEIYDARRALRKMLVVTLLSEGMAIDEIARTFHIPIEHVCDIANEMAKPIDN
jgi:hypothetical protein